MRHIYCVEKFSLEILKYSLFTPGLETEFVTAKPEIIDQKTEI